MMGHIRTLTPSDLDSLIAMRQEAFVVPAAHADEERQRLLPRLAFTRGVFEQSQLASSMTLFPFTMYVAGKTLSVAGLAAVMSRPQYRRRGHIRMLLKDGLENLRAAGVAWCLAYPFDPLYYAKFGWQSVPAGLALEAPSQLLFRGRPPDALALSAADVADHSTLHSIYRDWAAQYTFTMLRDSTVRPDWVNLMKGERKAYLLDGAYVVLELQRSSNQTLRLEVHDYAFTHPRGRADLFRFLGSFHGQVDSILWRLPSDEPLGFDLQGYTQPIKHGFQARIVDVSKALQHCAINLPPGRSVTLGVSDDFCAWNNQSFRLSQGDNGLKISTETAEEPQLSLDVRTLTLLLSGGLRAVAAERAGLLRGALKYAQWLEQGAAQRVPFMSRADFF